MKLMDIYFHLKPDLEYVERWLNEEINAQERNLQKAASHLLKAGGKRIRPVFVLLAGQFGDYDIEKLGKIAVVLELIHMATLVHDDVIDNAKTRRGLPTVKAEWGSRMAMYTGDFIFARALLLLSEFPQVRIHQLLSEAIVAMCEGEIEQIRDFYNLDQGLRTYLRRIKRKTALLIELACTLGALVANVNDKDLKNIRRYGYFAGMAFQIVDDILDFTSTQDKLGKPVGNDLRQGNLTLPVLYALEHSPERDLLRKRIHRNMTEEEANEAISLVTSSGGIEYSHRMAEQYLEKCFSALRELPQNQASQSLEQIARFIAARDH
jgi:heptaprenyl diphosphate synthase